MPYTLLRIVPGGVVLCGYHLRRLGLEPGTAAYRELARWAGESAPGVFAVRVEGECVRAEARGESRLVEGIATRFAVSPAAVLRKPSPGLPGRGTSRASRAIIFWPERTSSLRPSGSG